MLKTNDQIVAAQMHELGWPSYVFDVFGVETTKIFATFVCLSETSKVEPPTKKKSFAHSLAYLSWPTLVGLNRRLGLFNHWCCHSRHRAKFWVVPELADATLTSGKRFSINLLANRKQSLIANNKRSFNRPNCHELFESVLNNRNSWLLKPADGWMGEETNSCSSIGATFRASASSTKLAVT